MLASNQTVTDYRPQSVTTSDRSLFLNWDNGSQSEFHYLWLRDNCPQLRHASTNHRVVETSEIPSRVRPQTATLTPDASLEIQWEHDGHRSIFDAAWLAANDYSRGARYQRPTRTTWTAASADELPHATYADLIANDNERIRFLDGFLRFGLGFLHAVPCEPGTVLDVARFLGELRTTSWGTVFDVISQENANSVAYTNLPLVVHTDEGYRDPAPTVQLQHFLRADSTGGASTLTDGFAVAERLRATEPEMFRALTTTILKFHFADATAEHEAFAPIISLGPDGEITAIRYSNHSALPFLVPAAEMESFYEAYQTFGRLREGDEFQLRIALGTGDLYIVDNHRIMHGRTGFQSNGARHLQSCYVERDELVSRLTVLRKSVG